MKKINILAAIGILVCSIIQAKKDMENLKHAHDFVNYGGNENQATK